MSSSQTTTATVSAVVDSLILGEGEEVAGGGILCNDAQGLCLSVKGSVKGSENPGVYTNLVRLVSQLPSSGSDRKVAPLITIETDSTAILVKEYAGHTVVFQVPKNTPATSSSEPGGIGTNGSTAQ